MKTRFLVLTLLFAIGTAAVAQEAKPKFSPEKFVEKKVEMMQKSLMLDDKTAEKFASIYKEYLLEQAKCRPNIVRGKDLTDAQIKQNIEARMDAKQKALDVEKKYYGKLAKILNAKHSGSSNSLVRMQYPDLGILAVPMSQPKRLRASMSLYTDFLSQ